MRIHSRPTRRSVVACVVVATVFALLPSPAVAGTPSADEGASVADTAPTAGDPVPGRLLVSVERELALEPHLPAQASEVANAALDRLGVRVVEVVPGREQQAKRALEATAGVLEVELDRTVTHFGIEPNDPEWPRQWSPQLTNAPLGWTLTQGSEDVIVAVLDTGVETGHRDLKEATIPGRNVLNGTNDVTDGHGHGTSVAGIIAARTNNSIGVASYCWKCSLMPVKVLHDDGTGTTSDVAAGIVWATDNDADVINLSLGGPKGTSALHSATKYARDRGVLVIAAAGNNGKSDPYYPAAYEEVLGAAATDSSDRRYDWSNYGSWVDLAAPGCNRSTKLGGGVSTFCGTSSAAPVVAGIAGLTLSYQPDVQLDDQVTALREGTVAVGSFVAHGRSDTYLSLDSVPSDSSDTKPPTWSTSARLSAVPSGFSTVDLSWPSARDDTGITGYRVLVDGRVITHVSGRSYRARNLKHTTSYTFAVQARDAAGNWSKQLKASASTFTRFRDVPRGSTFEKDIGWLAAHGVTRGCNPPTNDRFCPADSVTRAQMAAFMTRALDLKKTSGIRFRDVPGGSTFEKDIDKLATAGITRGCNPPTNDRFCPSNPVTRAQMAAFMVRGLNLTKTSGIRFRDVPRGSTFEKDIDKLATAGITRGCNPPTNDRFCPSDPVTRAQMAAFIRRADP